MKEKKSMSVQDEDQRIVEISNRYKQEAFDARVDRMTLNDENYNIYHMKQDWSHKVKGQSKEFLPKQAMAVEQLTSFIKQGLLSLDDDWFSVEKLLGVRNPVITENDIKTLTLHYLKKANGFTVIEDGLKLSFLGSLMIYKVHPVLTRKTKFVEKRKLNSKLGKVESKVALRDSKVWTLGLTNVAPKDYFPDPTGRGLYEAEYIEEDFYKIKAMIRSAANPNGIYEKDVVDQLTGDFAKLEEEAKTARLNNQNIPTTNTARRRVSLMEYWGTILDEQGEVLHENVVWTIANDRYLIRKPTPNPFWHQESPYVVGAMIRVPKSVWHKAIMDAPSRHNRALNEIYNLIFDNGMMAVHGIKQLRSDWVADQSKISEGIKAGDTIEVNSQCPPGEKVLESVVTAIMSPEAIQAFQLTQGEFQQSALTNDLRLGVLPQRQVKATEIVATEQSITSMLNGLTQTIEGVIVQLLRKSWMVAIQHIEDFDSDEIKKLLGEQKAMQISQMSRAERFVQTVNGLTFNVYGLSHTLKKVKDFQKIQGMLQTLATTPALLEEFAKKYSTEKLFDVIIRALDINPKQIELDELDRQENAVSQAAGVGAVGGGAPQGGPNMQSQIPQANSARSGVDRETMASMAQPGSSDNPMNLPPSRAVRAIQRGSA